MKTFTSVWESMDAENKRALAESLETSVPYLSQLAHGYRSPGKHLAKAIEIEVGHRRCSLFPDAYSCDAA